MKQLLMIAFLFASLSGKAQRLDNRLLRKILVNVLEDSTLQSEFNRINRLPSIVTWRFKSSAQGEIQIQSVRGANII